MTGRVLGLAALQATVFWVVGFGVVRLALPGDRADPNRSETDDTFATSVLLAVPGFVLVSVVLMVLHMLSGGRVFSNPWVVPIVLILAVLGAVKLSPGAARGRLASGRGVWGRRGLVVLIAAGALALYVLPAVIAGSGVRSGDPPWHLGWTEQLLGGEGVPVGPAPEFARNAYPWGHHAVLATLVRAVPGTDPLIAHEALHLVLVLGLPLAAAMLARVVHRRAAVPAAIAMAFVGGWGWLETRAPSFWPSPRHADMADLAVGSPNSVYEMLPPAFPRELGLVLLGTLGVTLARSVAMRSTRGFLMGGVILGLTGLVSLPMFIAGVLWVCVAVLGAPGIRMRVAISSFGGAAVLVGLWAVPVVWNYVAHGGFVNVTPRLGREWSPREAIASWGLLAPAALAGAVLAWRRSPGGRILVGFALATAGLLGISIARGEFGWTLAGQATLFHQGRVWPVAHLLGSALAGLAAWWLWDRGRRKAPALTAAVLGLLVAVASISPVLASVRLTEYMEERRFGFVYSDPEVSDPRSFLQRAAAHMGPRDSVLVAGSDDLAFFLFQFSGVRLAAYDDPVLDGNDLRIRYRDLADAWDETMRAGGFGAPAFVVALDGDAPPAGLVALEDGTFRGETWVLYGSRNGAPR